MGRNAEVQTALRLRLCACLNYERAVFGVRNATMVTRVLLLLA
jgi:hypothetical protein